MRERESVCVYVCVCVRACVRVYIHKYTHMYTPECIYVYTYAYIYTYIHYKYMHLCTNRHVHTWTKCVRDSACDRATAAEFGAERRPGLPLLFPHLRLPPSHYARARASMRLPNPPPLSALPLSP